MLILILINIDTKYKYSNVFRSRLAQGRLARTVRARRSAFTMGNSDSHQLVADQPTNPHLAFLSNISADPGDVGTQIAKFRKLGFVVLRNAVRVDDCASIDRFACIFGSCEGNRCSTASRQWWHCDTFVQSVLLSDSILNLTEQILHDWQGRFYIAKLGGDLAGPGVDDQDVHRDSCGELQRYARWGLGRGGWKVVDPARDTPCIAWMIAVHDIGADQGPLRIASWDYENGWVRQFGNVMPDNVPFRVNIPTGWAVVRDVRLLHGGSANRTSSRRNMPGFVATSREMMSSGYSKNKHYRPTRNCSPYMYKSMQKTRLGGSHLDYVWDGY